MLYNNLRSYSLYLAWLVTLFMTLGSLYGSEILHWPICHLCWYQRIFSYPLVIILGIAAYRLDYGIKIYVLPLAVLGVFFSGYQYLTQMIPGFNVIQFCGLGPSCADTPFKLFGFITLPLLALIGFSLILFFLLISKPEFKK